MADYISREEAINTQERRCLCCPVDNGSYYERRLCYACAVTTNTKQLLELPAADVRTVAEISNAVDEVLDFLKDNYNCMPYHIYSALFDLVSGICPNCGAEMREETK